MAPMILLWLGILELALVAFTASALNDTSYNLSEIRIIDPTDTFNGNAQLGEVTEQDRIDAIVKAFKHLPTSELDRLNLSLHSLQGQVVAGSPEADALFSAWTARQKEIKDALGSIVQPIEEMMNVTILLRQHASESEDVLVAALTHLEDLLSDIDNARNYHAQGYWDELVSALSPDRPLRVQYTAAWVIGTAIKSSYDYQLWVLEPRPSYSFTCLDRLVALLCTDTKDAHKNVLYAISSAARGNVNVQEHLIESSSQEDSFLSRIESIVQHPSEHSFELVRKVWAFVSDMLQERKFVRFGLAATHNLTETQLAEFNALALLGDHFLTRTWLDLAVSEIESVVPLSSPSHTGVVERTSVQSATFKSVVLFLLEALQQRVSLLDEVLARKIQKALSHNSDGYMRIKEEIDVEEVIGKILEVVSTVLL